MPQISFELSLEKFQKIEERCALLKISQHEYANWMYTIGQWVLDKSEEGRIVVAMDMESGKYREFSASLLDKFLEAHKAMKALLKPSGGAANENTA